MARRLPALVLFLLALLGSGGSVARAQAAEEDEGDPAEVVIGERLFLETRFSQYFYAHAGGNPNAVLAEGDPVVARLATPSGSIPGPFAGQAMSCRQCHMVDDATAIPGGGGRTYADFARRSPIPAREDGARTTPRNSPALVAAGRNGFRDGMPFVLHFDGEFPSTAALVKGTFTGRNLGWLPSEHATAIAHLASVVRGDDGTGALARDTGGAYRRVLAGTDPTLPRELRLPPRYRLDVDRATDLQILDAVARLVAAYVDAIAFPDEEGKPVGSPYDRFLEKNHLPRAAHEGERGRVYRLRLELLLADLTAPVWVTEAEDGPFRLHTQPFVFGPLELEGLRIFLDRDRGNCVACHPPPAFTDFAMHDSGVTQLGYDAIHGLGSFDALHIPSDAERTADPDRWLPRTPAHPDAAEPFRAIASGDAPGRTDLGVWNLLNNPDFADPKLQKKLLRLVCLSRGHSSGCRRRLPTRDAQLDAAVGLFKTPSVRDLGQSNPYFHTGDAEELEDVVTHYVRVSQAGGTLRNGDPALRRMRLTPDDVAPLAAFLRSLNEDYD